MTMVFITATTVSTKPPKSVRRKSSTEVTEDITDNASNIPSKTEDLSLLKLDLRGSGGAGATTAKITDIPEDLSLQESVSSSSALRDNTSAQSGRRILSQLKDAGDLSEHSESKASDKRTGKGSVKSAVDDDISRHSSKKSNNEELTKNSTKLGKSSTPSSYSNDFSEGSSSKKSDEVNAREKSGTMKSGAGEGKTLLKGGEEVKKKEEEEETDEDVSEVFSDEEVDTASDEDDEDKVILKVLEPVKPVPVDEGLGKKDGPRDDKEQGNKPSQQKGLLPLWFLYKLFVIPEFYIIFSTLLCTITLCNV